MEEPNSSTTEKVDRLLQSGIELVKQAIEKDGKELNAEALNLYEESFYYFRAAIRCLIGAC